MAYNGQQTCSIYAPSPYVSKFGSCLTNYADPTPPVGRGCSGSIDCDTVWTSAVCADFDNRDCAVAVYGSTDKECTWSVTNQPGCLCAIGQTRKCYLSDGVTVGHQSCKTGGSAMNDWNTATVWTTCS